MDAAGLWIEIPAQAFSRLPERTGLAVRADSSLPVPREARPPATSRPARSPATSWRIEPYFFPPPVLGTESSPDFGRYACGFPYRHDERTGSWD